MSGIRVGINRATIVAVAVLVGVLILLALAVAGVRVSEALFSDRNSGNDFNTLNGASNTSPEGIWSDGTTMWVADYADDKLYAYNLITKLQDTDKDFDTLQAAGNNNPTGLWSDGTTMWVADAWDSKLYAYKRSDTTRDDDKDYTALNGAGNNSPRGIWSNGSTMWVADFNDDKLYAYNNSTRTRNESQDFETLAAAGNNDPMDVWSDGTTMWVSDRADSKLYAYNLNTKLRDAAKDYNTLGAAGNSDLRGIWSDGTTMWVADSPDDKIYGYAANDDPIAPPQVEGLTLTETSLTSITATWTASAGADEYAVEIATNIAFTLGRTKSFTDSLTFTFTGLTAGQEYYVRVKPHTHDDIWVSNSVGDNLWRVNSDDPDDVSGEYGLVGSFPSGLTSAQGIEMDTAAAVWVIDSDDAELWRINSADPDDESGTFGSVGSLTSGLDDPRGLARDGSGDLWITDSTDLDIWKIDPSDPDRFTGGYGLFGTPQWTMHALSAAAFAPDGEFYMLDPDTASIWNVDLDRLPFYGSTSYCTMPTSVRGIVGLSIDSHGDAWIADIHHSDDRLWRVDLDDCTRTTGGFGDQGTFDSTLTGPDSLSMIERPDGPWSDYQSMAIGAPAAPGTPSASLSGGTMTVSWTASSTTGANAATGYKVQYRVQDSITFATSASVYTGTSATFNIATLTTGLTYQFRVRAINAAAAGTWTAWSTGLSYVSFPSAPAAPTLTASDGQLVATWTAPNNNGADIADYDLQYRAGNTGSFTDWTDAIGTNTSSTITSLTNAQSYEVRVRAANAQGESPWSNAATGTPATLPARPAYPTVAQNGDTQATWSWVAPSSNGAPITGYDLQYGIADGSDAVATWLDWSGTVGTATVTTVTGLQNGVKYGARVRATNNQGTSDWSALSSSSNQFATPAAAGPTLSVSTTSAVGGTLVTLAFSPISTYPHVRFEIGSGVGHLQSQSYHEITSVYRNETIPTILVAMANGTAIVTAGVSSTNADLYRSCYRTLTSDPWFCGTIVGNQDLYRVVEWSAGAELDPAQVTGITGVESSTEVALSWTDVGDVDEYHVRWKSGAQSFANNRRTVVNTNSATISGLTTGTTYDFQVTARRYGALLDGLGVPSAAKAFTPDHAPAAPSGLTAAWNEETGVVDLAWTATAGGTTPDGYQILRRGTGTSAYGVLVSDTGNTAVTSTDSTAGSSTTSNHWDYQVKARNGTVVGAASATASVLVPRLTAPGAPVASVSVIGNGTLTVNWSVPSNTGGRSITGYEVRYKIHTLSVFSTHSHTGISTSTTITGLTNDQIYDVQVRAVNGNGMGDWSASAYGTPTQTLALEHFDTAGLNIDALALVEVGGGTIWYAVSPHTVAGSILSGELGLGNANSPITKVTVTAGHVLLNNGSTLNLGAYVGTGGAGEGLHLFLQSTPDGSDRRKSTSIASSGANDLEYAITPLGLTNGDRVLVALARHIPPGQVEGVTVTPYDTILDVAWDEPAEEGFSTITTYDISYRTGSGNWTEIQKTAPASDAVIPGLTNGTAYQVRVRAANAQSNGAWSDTVTGTPTQVGVPDAPTAPSLTHGGKRLEVTWTAPSDNGGSAITGYGVQYRTGTSGAWTSRTHNGTAVSTSITGLENGQPYQVAVRAINSNGNGPWSQATLGTPSTTPGAPIAPNIATYGAVLDVRWSRPADTGGADITGYDVQYGVADGSGMVSTWIDWPHNNDTTYAVINGLNSATVYGVRIRAINGNGDGSWSSTSLSNPNTVPAKITSLNVTAALVSLNLTWNPPADGGALISSYDVQYRAGNSGPWLTTNVTFDPLRSDAASIGGLTNGTSYEVQMRAVNRNGDGPWSDTVTGTPADKPADPDAPTLLAGDHQLTVTWVAPASNGSAITDYDVEYREGSSGDWTVHTHGSTATTATVTGLTNGQSYQVQVAARNSQGLGLWSQATSGTPFAVPTVPTNVTVVGGDEAFTLNWGPPADSGGYPVTNYFLLWKETSSQGNFTPIILGGTLRSRTVSGLTNGTQYSVYIIARTTQGSSPQSATLTVTPVTTAPDPPTGLTLMAGNRLIVVSWTAPSNDGGHTITGYSVEYRPGTSGNWTDRAHGGISTSATIVGLTNAQSYEVRVAATNSQGTGLYTSASATPTYPITITGVTVGSIDTQSATITATIDNPDAQSATVHIRYQATPTDGSWLTPTTSSITSSGTSAVFDNELDNVFTPGTEYTMQVSLDSSNFAASEAVTFTTHLVAVVGDLTVTNVTPDSATFTARIDNNYGAVQTVYFQYYAGSPIAWSGPHEATGISDAQWLATGLTPAAVYNVRAYTAADESTKIRKTFSTFAVLSLSTNTVENIGLTTATLVAGVQHHNGNESTIEFGHKKASGSNWITSTVVGIASARLPIAGLTPGILYDTRARIGTMTYLTNMFTTVANYATNVNITFSASTTATFDVEFTNPTSKDETVYLRYKPDGSPTWLVLVPPDTRYITKDNQTGTNVEFIIGSADPNQSDLVHGTEYRVEASLDSAFPSARTVSITFEAGSTLDSDSDFLSQDIDIVITPDDSDHQGMWGFRKDVFGKIDSDEIDALGTPHAVIAVEQLANMDIVFSISPCPTTWDLHTMSVQDPADPEEDESPRVASLISLEYTCADRVATWVSQGAAEGTLGGDDTTANPGTSDKKRIVLRIRSLYVKANSDGDLTGGGTGVHRRGTIKGTICALPDMFLGPGACGPLMVFVPSLAVVGLLFSVAQVRHPVVLSGAGIVTLTAMAALVLPGPIMVIGFIVASLGTGVALLMLRR